MDIAAATLAQAGDPSSAGLFDGIEDIAGNSLDGNRNGQAQGPMSFYDLGASSTAGDSARFYFATSDNILLGAPALESTSPETTLGAQTPGASLALPIEMSFDRAIAMTTLNSKNIFLAGKDTVTGGTWDTWWTLEGENLPDNRPPETNLGRSLGRIVHGGLWKETQYVNEVSSRVRDLYQNCYYPAGGAVSGGTCTPELLQEPTVYCCNGAACAPGDVNCIKCGF